MKLYRYLNVRVGYEFFSHINSETQDCIMFSEIEVNCTPLTDADMQSLVAAHKDSIRESRIAQLQREIDALKGE